MRRIFHLFKILSFIWFLILVPSSAMSAASSEETHHTGRYWYFVDNIDYTEGNEERSILLWVVLPTERPGQEVKVTGIHPEPT